jgi:hypothetical protein
MLFSPCTSIRLTPASTRRLRGRSRVPPPAPSPFCERYAHPYGLMATHADVINVAILVFI